MLPWERLRDKLLTLEGKPYQAYKALEGEYRFERFVLNLHNIAQDPGTSSPMRVRVDRAEAQFPSELWSTRTRKIALEDFIARRWLEMIRKMMRGAHAGRGSLGIEAGGQEMLERTACRVTEEWIEIRGTLTWPSDARKTAPKAAQTMITEEIPQLINGSLIYSSQQPAAVQTHVHLSEDSEALREQLGERGLVAFIADGAVLLRDPASDRPVLSHLVTWQSPSELRVTVTVPHRGSVTGLGIPRGVTVILGPPMSGRSTLLRAIAACVYGHVPGDGREFCATAVDAVAVAAEPGRRVEGVKLQPFVTQLGTGEDVTHYRTEQAPALLSQVAAISEALEAGCSLLLLDEDWSAAGAMAQDPLLARLFPQTAGRIIPLVALLRPLYEEHGVSSVIVANAAGDYAKVADTIIAMDGLRPAIITSQAKQLAADAQSEPRRAFAPIHHRVPLPEAVGQFRGGRQGSESSGAQTVTIGREIIELARLYQLVEPGQSRAIGAAILRAAEQGYVDGSRTIREILALVDSEISQRGLDVLEPVDAPVGNLARPRRHEVAAVLNRLRSLRVKS